MKTILIVDDDEAVLTLLEAFLTSKAPVKVIAARNGLEGMDLVRSRKPDVIVLDVMMPKMDGYGFVRELKKDSAHRSIPVVVLTAKEMMRDLFVQEGVSDFLAKPYEPEELFRVVSKYL